MLIIHNIECTQINDKQQIWECVECGYKFLFSFDEAMTCPRKEILVRQPDPINTRHYGSTVPGFMEVVWFDVAQAEAEQ